MPFTPIDTTVFRPHGALATLLVVGPSFVLLGLMVGYLIAAPDRQTSLILLGIGSGLALGWLVVILGFARVLLVTIRATGEGIAANYPWGKPRTLRWRLVDRVDRRLGFLRLHSSDNTNVVLIEGGLEGGERLLRQIVLRVSPTVLSTPLQHELALMGGGVFASAIPPETPRLTLSPLWFSFASLIAAGGVALGIIATINHVGWMLILGVVVGLLGALALIALRQAIIVTESGITLFPGIGRPVTMTWVEIRLIEQLPLEMLFAFRAEKRIIFIGSFFMTVMRRNLLRNAIRQHLLSRGVALYQRWWIL